MKITYYGTAAGEGWPGIFCNCEICQEARRLGGKNIRTRSQALINDDLLLDFPPDSYLHSLYYGLDLGKVRTLLFTHSHSDHCHALDIELLREPYSHTYTGQMQIYGNDAVQKAISDACNGLGSEEYRFQYHLLECNQTITTGGYTVTALRATHDPGERCLFYRVAQGDKSVLYAHDTGLLTEENLQCLSEQKGKLNLVSFDCTCQKDRDGKYHMGFADAVEQKDVLLRRGLADENTIWVVNHFSHNGGWLHEEISRRAKEQGMIASYDGMAIEF
ncbi:MAG: hypothetical protein K6G30_02435 [Acetatifactor sp.]|nr:hypothetical protein [Acetatifactor sp.]